MELTVALNKAWRSRHDYVETPNTDYVDYENILEEIAKKYRKMIL